MLNGSCIHHFHSNDFLNRWLFKEKQNPGLLKTSGFLYF
jgi:hypothetical protein